MPFHNLISRKFFLTRLPGLAAAAAILKPRALQAGHLDGKSAPERMIDNAPSFEDGRSRKVIFVAHCVLNQNARCAGCNSFPASIPQIPQYLLENNIGIAQYTCPELASLGLGRLGNIYDQLSTAGNRRFLQGLAQDIIYQTNQYRKHGFKVLAVLGIDSSPCCGVNSHAYNGNQPGKGALMEELSAALAESGVDLPLIGIDDRDPGQALEQVKALLG